MPVVSKVVNLMGPDHRLVTLHPGDSVPDWALSLVTNPRVLATEPPRVESVESVIELDDNPAAPALADLKKAELVELCEARGLDSKGNKPELIARLEAADEVSVDAADGHVDVWSLSENELRELAAQLGVDVSEASSQVELATAIEQARQ